jgi:hypothetical protein
MSSRRSRQSSLPAAVRGGGGGRPRSLPPSLQLWVRLGRTAGRNSGGRRLWARWCRSGKRPPLRRFTRDLWPLRPAKQGSRQLAVGRQLGGPSAVPGLRLGVSGWPPPCARTHGTVSTQGLRSGGVGPAVAWWQNGWWFWLNGWCFWLNGRFVLQPDWLFILLIGLLCRQGGPLMALWACCTRPVINPSPSRDPFPAIPVRFVCSAAEVAAAAAAAASPPGAKRARVQPPAPLPEQQEGSAGDSSMQQGREGGLGEDGEVATRAPFAGQREGGRGAAAAAAADDGEATETDDDGGGGVALAAGRDALLAGGGRGRGGRRGGWRGGRRGARGRGRGRWGGRAAAAAIESPTSPALEAAMNSDAPSPQLHSGGSGPGRGRGRGRGGRWHVANVPDPAMTTAAAAASPPAGQAAAWGRGRGIVRLRGRGRGRGRSATMGYAAPPPLDPPSQPEGEAEHHYDDVAGEAEADQPRSRGDEAVAENDAFWQPDRRLSSPMQPATSPPLPRSGPSAGRGRGRGRGLGRGRGRWRQPQQPLPSPPQSRLPPRLAAAAPLPLPVQQQQQQQQQRAEAEAAAPAPALQREEEGGEEVEPVEVYGLSLHPDVAAALQRLLPPTHNSKVMAARALPYPVRGQQMHVCVCLCTICMSYVFSSTKKEY